MGLLLQTTPFACVDQTVRLGGRRQPCRCALVGAVVLGGGALGVVATGLGNAT